MWTFFVLFLLVNRPVAAQNVREPIFKDGDRVCFVGNSITNNGQFYNYINLYYGTRYPDRRVEFINCGISGDVTQGILNRMESDILVHKPTWCVLMIGMNDVNRNLYAQSRIQEEGIEQKKQKALDVYFKNLEIIVQKLIQDGRQLIIQKPTIYDQTGLQTTENFFGVNDALKKCADFGQQLADKYKLPSVDYWTLMTEINKSVQEKDSTKTIIGADRVHPGPVGHLLMAYEFLKSTGGAKYVSEIVIDKNQKKSNTQSSRCQVSDLTVGKHRFQFTVREESLPFPVDEQAVGALELVPFMEEFNQQILKVQNIAAGDYQLTIDNTDIGSFSAKELKSGVNLAQMKATPQYQQAAKVMKLYAEYRKSQSMYRNIVAIEIHHLPDSLKNSDKKIIEDFLNERLEKQYKTSSHYNYYSNQYKAYLVNKSKEKEIIASLSNLLEEIYQANKPTNHVFKLQKQL